MKFDSIKKKHLLSEERRIALPPQDIVSFAGVKRGDVVIDFGCGNGFLEPELAKAVMPTGKIYAIDISREMIEDLVKNLPEEFKGIVHPIILMSDTWPLLDASSDFVFMVNLIHEVEDKHKLMNEAKRVLKKSGKLVVVEWKKVSSPKGPPLEERIAEKDMLELLRKAGFKVVASREYPYHYQMVVSIV